MSAINFQRTYHLGDSYGEIAARIKINHHRYLDYPDVISFNELDKSITFYTERLIPSSSGDRPRVMLLFSNPHPHSIHQGMFLSPGTKGRENLFWPTMRDAGWMTFPETTYSPKQLAEICLKAEYQGPFEFIFYCYYAFPSNYPEDLRKIFGIEYFDQLIAPEARDELSKTINETDVVAVVTFNKGIFNLESNTGIDCYIDRLKGGEVIQGQIVGIDRKVPIYLTFPTGWHYHKEYKKFRKSSLEAIGEGICNR